VGTTRRGSYPQEKVEEHSPFIVVLSDGEYFLKLINHQYARLKGIFV
jgi:hypothetical protein